MGGSWYSTLSIKGVPNRYLTNFCCISGYRVTSGSIVSLPKHIICTTHTDYLCIQYTTALEQPCKTVYLSNNLYIIACPCQRQLLHLGLPNQWQYFILIYANATVMSPKYRVDLWTSSRRLNLSVTAMPNVVNGRVMRVY